MAIHFNFIFDTISMRLKSLFKKRIKKQNANNLNDNGRKGWFVLPFIPKVTKNFKHITNILNSKIAYFSLNKLGRIVRPQRNNLPINSNKNVGYKLCCKNCDASYVGQTKRRLTTRVAEHKNDINKKASKHSVITDHRLELNHEFDWENRRLTSEMINIKIQNNPLNLQSDTECLHYGYINILNKLK